MFSLRYDECEKPGIFLRRYRDGVTIDGDAPTGVIERIVPRTEWGVRAKDQRGALNTIVGLEDYRTLRQVLGSQTLDGLARAIGFVERDRRHLLNPYRQILASCRCPKGVGSTLPFDHAANGQVARRRAMTGVEPAQARHHADSHKQCCRSALTRGSAIAVKQTLTQLSKCLRGCPRQQRQTESCRPKEAPGILHVAQQRHAVPDPERRRLRQKRGADDTGPEKCNGKSLLRRCSPPPSSGNRPTTRGTNPSASEASH